MSPRLYSQESDWLSVSFNCPDAPIVSHTVATAQDAGWIWDIGLSSRRGVGHVYSSAYTSQDEAEQALRDYLKPTVVDVDALSIRKIPINAGHRERFWERNCVAIGLSAGFLEPLEASAILLVEIGARMIAEQLPVTRETMDIVAKRYNETFRYRWDRIIDFLKLHYCISKRTDTEFWIENRDPATIPDSLQELLTLWRFQYPWHDDFDRAVEVFPSASYQYVLYGMGFRTEPSHRGLSEQSRKSAMKHFANNETQTQKMLGALPTTRELINKIQQYGLQRV